MLYDISKLMEAFWKKVNKTESCWIWTACKDKDGYGKISKTYDGKLRHFRAHRISYEFHVGEIETNQVVMHSCDNPSCVNPKHLSVGTIRDNNHDAIAKGRRNYSSGEDHWTRKSIQKRDDQGKFIK